MRILALLGLLLAPGAAGAAPERLAVGAISRDGQITLTPAFSPDGQTAWFAQSDCTDIGDCPQRLTISRKVDGRWTPGQRVALPGDGPAANGAPSRVDDPSVSPDGRSLLFAWSVARADKAVLGPTEDFDLYRWEFARPGAVPVPLDMADINRPRAGRIARIGYIHNETAPRLTTAGDLYFWTERPDGVGDRDVFVAPADGKAGFQRARPLPAPINSPGFDTLGYVSPDGGTMLLGYVGRGGSGGTDLFVSVKRDGRWQPPVNLGPAVNSDADDFAPTLTPDGKSLVFASTRAFPGQRRGLLQVWTVPVADIPALRSLVRTLGSYRGRR